LVRDAHRLAIAQPVSAAYDDALAGLEAANDLDSLTGAAADHHAALVRGARAFVRDDDEHAVAAVRIAAHRGARHGERRIRALQRDDGGRGRAGRQLVGRRVDYDPYEEAPRERVADRHSRGDA